MGSSRSIPVIFCARYGLGARGWIIMYNCSPYVCLCASSLAGSPFVWGGGPDCCGCSGTNCGGGGMGWYGICIPMHGPGAIIGMPFPPPCHCQEFLPPFLSLPFPLPPPLPRLLPPSPPPLEGTNAEFGSPARVVMSREPSKKALNWSTLRMFSSRLVVSKSASGTRRDAGTHSSSSICFIHFLIPWGRTMKSSEGFSFLDSKKASGSPLMSPSGTLAMIIANLPPGNHKTKLSAMRE
mmetsp:Transcript_15783/g.42297  ORF Transcript_15783/g.42297 Transcript_15783/m.42297 type:complete len:238 (+) Transcript_15783:220-933(+)